mmetsp:Transcript_31649/g.74118  ORF Transcript_31649/g.74118 Transcript_31649/m.74118 type:complete len:234 (-) Transcript_31649:8-709(-)
MELTRIFHVQNRLGIMVVSDTSYGVGPRLNFDTFVRFQIFLVHFRVFFLERGGGGCCQVGCDSDICRPVHLLGVSVQVVIFTSIRTGMSPFDMFQGSGHQGMIGAGSAGHTTVVQLCHGLSRNLGLDAFLVGNSVCHGLWSRWQRRWLLLQRSVDSRHFGQSSALLVDQRRVDHGGLRKCGPRQRIGHLGLKATLLGLKMIPRLLSLLRGCRRWLLSSNPSHLQRHASLQVGR